MSGKKRLLMTSVNGVNKYACRKCGAVMAHRDTTHPDFSQGEYSESGGEFLQCTNPDCMITSDYPKMRASDFRHIPAIG